MTPSPPSVGAISPVACETAIRDRLRAEVLAAAGNPSEAVYEFWVPQSNERADVVVIADDMSGWEIKTERDSLKRLPRQAAAYARLFDRCTVVLAERHVSGALELLPEWWGVMAVMAGTQPPSFRTVRSAGPNDGVDAETLVRLLWREEVRVVLSSLGGEPAPRASRSSMWHRLLDVVGLEHLKELVRGSLLRRDPCLARIPTRRFDTLEVSD